MASGKIMYIRKVVGELDTNSYIVYRKEEKECILIDPGAEGKLLMNIIKERDLILTKIVLTHGHIDHCGGIDEILSLLKVPVLIHEKEVDVINSHINLDLGKSLGLNPPKTIDKFLKDGEIINLKGLSVKVLHTPGHSPGSICLKCNNYIFSGDTLFAGSIGRTDLPGGNYKTIMKSLENIKKLPINSTILPGHGEETDLKTELSLNPFL